MTTPRRLLNTNELCAALGISRKTLWRRARENSRFLSQFEVRLPLDCERAQRRFSGELVDRFLAGESVVRFGAGARRAS